MTSPQIELHIEELVLHGFATRDRHVIGEAFQAELHRLFTEQGSEGSHKKISQAHLDGGSFALQPGAPPATIGTQIAHSVYNSLTRKA